MFLHASRQWSFGDDGRRLALLFNPPFLEGHLSAICLILSI